MTTINYFNSLRANGVTVYPKDTIWIDAFITVVNKKKLIQPKVLEQALKKSLSILKEGNTSADAIALLKKFNIDYTPIEEHYQISLTKWKEILIYDL